MGHVNAVSLRNTELLKGHVLVIQEIVLVPISIKVGLQMEERYRFRGERHPITSTSPLPSNYTIPSYVALSKLELIFARFLDVVRNIYVNVLFLEVLKEAPSYLKLLR